MVSERGLYPSQGRGAWQAWHFLRATGGALGVVSQRGFYPSQGRGARQAWHQQGNGGQHLSHMFDGRRGISSTPEGVRTGSFPHLSQAPRAWQAWHFLDTRGGAQGVAQGLTGATDGIISAAATTIMQTCFTSAIITPAIF